MKGEIITRCFNVIRQPNKKGKDESYATYIQS